MWSLKGITFVWCFVLFSATIALPVTKTENDAEAPKPDPILVELQMPADEKPTDNSKPSEIAVDPKPIEAKPTEQTKPSESSNPIPTFIETMPMSAGPSRPQMLYDQRQDGKYNIRADLENFVILVVPSSGNSLLDLLKRSSQRQQQHNKRVQQTKHHKKYQSAPASAKPNDVKKSANRFDYLNRPESEDAAAIGEFIEGRTPYHVDISSDEISPPAPYGIRSLNGNAATIADLPLVNLDDNTASTSVDSSDPTVILSTVTGKSTDSMPISNDETSPRSPKSLTIDGYGNPFTSFNTVVLTRKSNANDQLDYKLSKNYNNYFSRKPSVQIVDKNSVLDTDNNGNDMIDNINSPVHTQLIDFTDSKTSFDSLNVGNIDRLALAGDSSTKADSDLANAQWELTLLGAEEQCGPDR